MQQFIVTKEVLNIRNKPSADGDDTFVGELLKDDVVFLHERAIIGTVPLGATSNVWHGDTFNRVVHSEGVRPRNYNDKKAEFLADLAMLNLHNGSDIEANWKVSWGHVDLEIWKIWKEFGAMGEDTKIVIIDRGIPENHPDLPFQQAFCHYAPADDGSVIDTNGHGTNCAGIAGAKGGRFVFGVAPKAQLLIVKAYDKVGEVTPDSLLDAIQWASEQQPDIISISFTTGETDKLSKKLEECSRQGIIILAAVGNAGANAVKAVSAADTAFPACKDFCTAVGALSKDSPTRYVRTTPSRKIKFLVPGEKIMTATLMSAGEVGKDSSIATPFLAGVIAIIISMIKQGKVKISRSGLVDLLYESGTTVSETIGDSELKYKIPQPYFLINQFLNA